MIRTEGLRIWVSERLGFGGEGFRTFIRDLSLTMYRIWGFGLQNAKGLRRISV